jgi:hypothetical protein
MRPLVLILLTQLSACYSIDQERFAAYAAEIAQPGMPMAQATERLSVAGFSCDPRSSQPATTCTRTRQSLLPYTCIERVNLIENTKERLIDSVTVPAIVCAGF